jgi:pyruvate-formate lyase
MVIAAQAKNLDGSSFEMESPGQESITRLRQRYQSGPAYISIERAKYYTESWKETEGREIPLPVRVALAMKNVYEKMTQYLDPNDRIAGYWSEFFLGIPIDIERGVFNQVLETELDKASIIYFRARSLLKSLSYMIRKKALKDLIRNRKIMRAGGSTPLNLGLKTMSEREINPFQIIKEDKLYLKRKLLPYWKGKTIVDYLEKEMANSGFYSKDMQDFIMAVSGNTSRQVLMISICDTISSFQGHVILDYERILAEGLRAMNDKLHERLSGDGELSGPERDFLKSIEIALDGVMIFARRVAERIKEEIEREVSPERKGELEQMLARCLKVPFEPAETFTQAVQSIWTVKTAVELAHPVNLHCFGRLDQTLYPYYRRDLKAGRITPGKACELLEELLLKIMSQNIRPESNVLANFYHRYLGSSPVTLGGVNPDGEDETNDLTYLFIEAAARSRAITNIAVRVHPGTPDSLLFRVADALHDGSSSFALFNDQVNIEAMKRKGFAVPDAYNYAIMGCVEMTCPGKTGSMSANALLLSRLLDLTLRNGDSRTLTVTIKEEGKKTGDPDSFGSFEDLITAFLEQGRYMIKKIVDASNLRDRLFAERLPAPYISAFIDGCLDKKRDVTQGGGVYDLSGISMINSIANLTDSLYVIKDLIFDKKKCTFKELLEAIDHNFVGYESLYQEIKKLSGKWGNGNPETDELARRVMKELFQESYKYRSFKNGVFVVYVISMTTHTIDGRLSIASPDGRRAATPYAASCNPYNVERSGVTAVLRSLAHLPFEDVMGCAVNVRFHPTGIGENPESRAKWVSLIRTYFQLGGAQIQPTVASAETLKLAQREPENYRDLIVKVGGYSTYFVELGREIQEEIIARTEHC